MTILSSGSVSFCHSRQRFSLMKITFPALMAAFVILACSFLSAQGPGGGPPSRKHTANTAQPLELIPATERTPAKSKATIRKSSDEISIRSNGIPDHKVGPFPNPGNPNEISEQSQDVVIPGNPEPAPDITFIHDGRGVPQVFGITLDGVLIEPGTAEVWMGDRASGWNYEALGNAVPLGLDSNYGHVQPTGKYHYHGIPTGLMQRLGAKRDAHSPMIGWAADGFPIYALNGYSDPLYAGSAVVKLKTSYRLKVGARPPQPEAPGGTYDGAFVQDYEYAEGLGDLDECNGRFCVTPEFPGGTYAYFMTKEWPIVPRAYRGTSVNLRGPGGPGGPDGRPPGAPDGPPPGMEGRGRPPGGGPPPPRERQ
jgi:hypothetical protein